MLTAVATCVLFGATAPLNPATAEPLRVWLDGHRGALDLSGEQPVLRFRALAHSALPVPVEAIEVGVLFARDGDALVAASPGTLYGGAPAEGERTVGAVRLWIDTQLGPGGEEAVLIESALSPQDPEPVHWVTHVLGYRLADVDAALLQELVHSEIFADEMAAVETLALAGDVKHKRAVRARWGGRVELIEALIAMVRAPVGASPGIDVAIERVMAVRALGVLGGERAEETLRALLDDPSQAALTEPLLVMSSAHLRSPLETPVAHTLPPEARRMADVAAAALDDVNGWADPVDPAPELPDAEAAPVATDRVDATWVVAVVAVAMVVALMVVVVLRLRKRA